MIGNFILDISFDYLGGFVKMILELTDLHNRRRSIAYVAREAQINLTPFLTWPEDKQLLRLSDLPLIQGRPFNTPTTWRRVNITATCTMTSDCTLRDFIIIGRAYFRSFAHHSGLTVVTELEVNT